MTQAIHLDSQALTDLPSYIASMPALTHLSAYDNALTTLPDWYGRCVGSKPSICLPTG